LPTSDRSVQKQWKTGSKFTDFAFKMTYHCRQTSYIARHYGIKQTGYQLASFKKFHATTIIVN